MCARTHACIFLIVLVPHVYRRDSGSLGIRVTGSCKHPAVGAEDQTQVLCENRRYSPTLGYLSLFFLHIVNDVKLVRSITILSAQES